MFSVKQLAKLWRGMSMGSAACGDSTTTSLHYRIGAKSKTKN